MRLRRLRAARPRGRRAGLALLPSHVVQPPGSSSVITAPNTGGYWPGAGLSLSDNPNPNALNDSCNRMYI